MEWVVAPKPHQRMFTVLWHPEAVDGFWLAGGGREDRQEQCRPGDVRDLGWLEDWGGQGPDSSVCQSLCLTWACPPQIQTPAEKCGAVLSHPQLPKPSHCLACLPHTSSPGAAQERWWRGLTPGDLEIPGTHVCLGRLVQTYLMNRTRACSFLMECTNSSLLMKLK